MAHSFLSAHVKCSHDEIYIVRDSHLGAFFRGRAFQVNATSGSMHRRERQYIAIFTH